MLGRKRAAIWRALGFANLAKGRAVLAEKRLLARAKSFSPYYDRDDIARYNYRRFCILPSHKSDYVNYDPPLV